MGIGAQPLARPPPARPAAAARGCARGRPLRLRCLCTSRTSLTCFSMVCSGFSEVMGSWKIMAIRLPRTARSTVSLAPSSSWPWNWMLPLGMPRRRIGQELQDRQRRHRLAGAALAHQAERLATVEIEGDLAHGGQLAARRGEGDGEIADAQQGRRGLGHATVFRGSKASRTASPTKTSRLSMTARTRKPVRPSQGAWRLALPWARISPSEGEPGGQPEAQEVEGGQGGDGAVQDEGQEGERRHHGVGQHVADHDDAVAHAEGPGRPHVVEVARAQELRAHHARPATSS